jgi:hypothetical protein
MDIDETSDDNRVVHVDFGAEAGDEAASTQETPHPPGSRRSPAGNPDVDGEALERSLEGLDRAGGGL